MHVRTYYDVLGLKQDVDDDTLKSAYRKLVKKYHPDFNPNNKAAEAKMRELNEAWEILGDAEKRKEYDQKLSGTSEERPFVTGQSSQPNRPMTQEEFYNMSKRFDDMFSPESLKKSANRDSVNKSGPINSADFFEHVIGFKIPKKK